MIKAVKLLLTDQPERYTPLSRWWTFGLIVSYLIAYTPILRNLILAWSRSDENSREFLLAPVRLYIRLAKARTSQGDAAAARELGTSTRVLISGHLCFQYSCGDKHASLPLMVSVFQ